MCVCSHYRSPLQIHYVKTIALVPLYCLQVDLHIGLFVCVTLECFQFSLSMRGPSPQLETLVIPAACPLFVSSLFDFSAPVIFLPRRPGWQCDLRRRESTSSWFANVMKLMSSTPSTGLFVCAHVYHLLEWLGGACMMFHPTTVFVAQCAIARVSVHGTSTYLPANLFWLACSDC